MPKFFVEKHNISHSVITLEDDGHMTKVLRMKVGDSILLCDGQKTDYLCEISSIALPPKNHKKSSTCTITFKILEVTPNQNEPDISISLYQCIPKSNKMDTIIQKCVELGIYRIIPVISEYTINRDISTEKLDRWRKISLSAAKQSGRGIIPDISTPVTIAQAISQLPSYDFAIMPYEKATQPHIKQVLKEINHVNNAAILIGAEGGFSPSEAESAHGIPKPTLGKRILRSETAGMYVLTVMLYELECRGTCAVAHPPHGAIIQKEGRNNQS